MKDSRTAARTARQANAPPGELIGSSSPDVLAQAAGDARLTEDLALALLERHDLPPHGFEELAKNAAVMSSRKVLRALVGHAKAPKHVSLPIVRRLYTFELMEIALQPATPPDVKVVADESIASRLDSISCGERLTLAKRGSNRLASALLGDSEDRVVRAALDNSHMTEAGILKWLMRNDPPPVLVEIVCRHAKWNVRRDIRIALLRSGKTPLAHAVAFAQSLPVNVLRDVLHVSKLPEKIKSYLTTDLLQREKAEAQKH